MSTSGSFGDPSLMDQLHHVEPLTSERAVSAMLPLCGELASNWNKLPLLTILSLMEVS